MENITKTAQGEHDGWPWSVTVTKSQFNTYTAEAVISCQMHNVRLCFPDNTQGEKGIPATPNGYGSYLTENPFRWIVGFIEGFIDGRNEQVAALLAGGKSTRKQLKQLLTQGDNMQPKTNPTEKQMTAMKAETDRFIDMYNAAGVMHLVKLAMGDSYKIYLDKIAQWKRRGRIPAELAHHLCKLEPVAAAGFTRESLRPDVTSWVQMDYPTKQANG